MATFIALWERPSDTEGFEDHYRNVHLPLCEKWPRVQAITTTRISSTATGEEATYHLVFTATFASRDDLKNALRSPEMMEAGKDAMRAAKQFGTRPTMLVGDDF